MSSQPPRRRRSNVGEDERGGLPMVPIFAGVIVAGLGIGALLSALAARRTATPVPTSTPVVVTHTPTPIVQRTVAASTPLPATPTPTPATPSPKPSAKATPKPSASPTPTQTPSPKPTPSPTPRKAPTTSPPVAVHTAAPASPVRSVAAATAAPVSTAVPPTPPRVASPAPAQPPANPQVGIAQMLVRRYLDAVAHGDDATANGALGGGGRLTEQQFLDPTMRITNISGSRNAAGGTKIQVEVTTAKGQYFGTYTVDGTGTVITEHAMIPVGGTTAR